MYDELLASLLVASPSIDIAGRLGSGELHDMPRAVRLDHPELFWVTGSDTFVGGGIVDEIEELRPGYNAHANDLQAAWAAFGLKANPVINFAAGFERQVDQVKAVHDWLTRNTVRSSESEDGHNAYDTLINGRATSEGYAAAFQYCVQKLGIPCALVPGAMVSEQAGMAGITAGTC